MTPRKLRELAGVSQVSMASHMFLSEHALRRLENMPTWAWAIDQLQKHASVCGYKIKIVAVDGHGVERKVT